MTGVYVDTILEIYERKIGKNDPINIDMAFLENKFKKIYIYLISYFFKLFVFKKGKEWTQ